MTTLELPFNIEHPDIKAGFKAGQDALYRETRPTNDMELVTFLRDVMADDSQRLAYNVGFLFGLYAQLSN